MGRTTELGQIIKQQQPAENPNQDQIGLAESPTCPFQGRAVKQTRTLAADLQPNHTRLDSLRFLLRDPDSKYSPAVDPVFQAEGMDTFKARPGTPDERAPRADHHNPTDRDVPPRVDHPPWTVGHCIVNSRRDLIPRIPVGKVVSG